MLSNCFFKARHNPKAAYKKFILKHKHVKGKTSQKRAAAVVITN